MSGVQQAVFQNQRSFGAPPGQQAYTTAGTYAWTAPTGVTSVSVVVVGTSKETGYGSALAYKNNITVVPGNSYSVFVSSTYATRCYFINTSTVSASYIANRTGDGGGNGGTVGLGGGAGGYAGNGGSGGSGGAGGNGSGGGGGGGGEGNAPGDTCSGGGGGVGLLGQGSNGTGGSYSNGSLAYGYGGGGGSGGGAGGTSSTDATVGSPGQAGDYGGGQGYAGPFGLNTNGAIGAVRIIWPGDTRSFPSTNTGNL